MRTIVARSPITASRMVSVAATTAITRAIPIGRPPATHPTLRASSRELALGRGERVLHQHRDRHLPDAPRHRRDPIGSLNSGLEIHVADELAAIQAVDPDVD